MTPQPDDCTFYQTIELPGAGICEGSWDHRGTESAYLGGVDFAGKRVLDVGPANGFFSFEIERRGATVTALDLGENSDWDSVPHPFVDRDLLRSELRKSVRRVENAFHFGREALRSNVNLLHGSVYDAAKLVETVDIALMGNVLQHFRDPFRAIEEVSKVVGDTLIITESLWNEDPGSRSMRLIPSANQPHVTQSWWIVPPLLVVEIVRLLGFYETSVTFHDQHFNGSLHDPAQLVRHYTVCAHRARVPKMQPIFRSEFGDEWHEPENKGNLAWRWSSRRRARVLVYSDSSAEQAAQATFGMASSNPSTHMKIYLNGEPSAEYAVSYHPLPVHLPYLYLKPGLNSIEFEGDCEAASPSKEDPRLRTFAIYNFLLAFRSTVHS